MNSLLQRLCFLIAVCLALFCAPAVAATIPEDGHSAVIMTYHRVSEETYPDSDIETTDFFEHIEEIQTGGYNVMALPDLVAAVKKGDALPPRTIAITFQGAFKSALNEAIPRLLEKKIPFTVFYAANNADSDTGLYMTWDDLKKLNEHKIVTLGVLPAAYTRLTDSDPSEIRRQLNKARTKHRENFGAEATLFSYPFGEYSAEYKKIVEDMGFAAAFGLQSGAIASSSDFFALPRFTLTEKYGDVDRFRTAAETLPFPASDIEPQGTSLAKDSPSIGFSVPQALVQNLKSLSCFATGQADPKIQILDRRVELRLADPEAPGRIRINCTLPGPANADDTPSWRWFGLMISNESAEEETPTQPPAGLP